MKAVITLLAGLITGIIIGVSLFGYFKHVLNYPVILTILPAALMFAVGFLVRGEGKKVEFKYKPYLHGSVQSLGSDGEKILMSAMKRVGLVREKR